MLIYTKNTALIPGFSFPKFKCQVQHIYETRFYSFHIYVLPITRDFLINFQKGRNIDELIESLRATGISSSNISAMLEKVKTQTNDKPKEIGKIEVKINDSKENVSK